MIIKLRRDPAPGGELLELGPVQFARGPEVEAFDNRTNVAQLCAAHRGLEAPGSDLAFDQKAKPFGMAQICDVILFVHVGEGISHSVELQLAQLLQGGVGQPRLRSRL